ncbi:CocE/NonD family hydrolase [Baekduia sp. Peel2402]|uniref:CocE/NonD family hydrolase n=1 Tax=Baekduia sp. Peel2402 TaxID=3458296 RepID=UPI00403E4CA6
MSAVLTTSLSVDRDVPIAMRDGVTLAADVWRCADAHEPRPVLLQRTAYDKGELVVAAHHAGLDPLRAIAAGYVVVIADVRGRFASEGDFEPFDQETADGADAIAWVRDQPFCDGRVFTYGTSYNGALQLLAPDADAAAVIEVASPFHDGLTRVGGAMSLSFLAAWSANDLAPAELARRELALHDVPRNAVATLRDDLAARRRRPLAAARALAAHDLGALGELVPSLSRWLAEPPRGAFPRADRPVLHVGGWHDLFLDATLACFADGGPRDRLVVGPWAHGVTGSRVGERDFGPDAPQALADTILSFFADPDATPRVRVFVMGANAWREESEWPPARAREQRLAIAPGEYAHDPSDPVPTRGGAIVCDPALGVPGPCDRAALSARRDVLTTTSAPLAAPLTLMGPVRAELNASTSAPETDWCVALAEVLPDGRALGIVDGVCRTYDDRPTVQLGHTAITIPAGHRLQVQISSSNFPRVDVHPEPARQRVAEGSTLVLPVVEGALS